MHFFLNKSGWSAEHGWLLKPDYAQLPHYLAHHEILRIRDSIIKYFGPETRWRPNMGDTQRRAIVNPEWEKLGPERDAFPENPYRVITVGDPPLKCGLQNPSHHQTNHTVG